MPSRWPKCCAPLTRKLKERADEFRPGEDYIKQRGYTVDKNGTVPDTN